MLKKICLLLCVSFITPLSVANAPQRIPVCFDFGCQSKISVRLADQEWQQIKNIFAGHPKSSDVERIRIAKGVAKMEQLIGNHTPIHNDIGYNVGPGSDRPGQLDCIDESLNTTTFLSLFEQAGFFNHHRVVSRAYRRALFDQHWSGQIEDIHDNQLYVVDSWFKANGEIPLVQTAEKWLDIPIFTSYLPSE